MFDEIYSIAFLKAFMLTQGVEIPIVWYLLSRSSRRADKDVDSTRLLAGAFLANTATLPYLWYVYPAFLDFTATVAAGEVTAFVAEAAAYHLVLGASIPAALIASLVANTCSVLAGLIVMPPF